MHTNSDIDDIDMIFRVLHIYVIMPSVAADAFSQNGFYSLCFFFFISSARSYDVYEASAYVCFVLFLFAI